MTQTAERISELVIIATITAPKQKLVIGHADNGAEVKKVEASDNGEYEWDGITIFDHNELLTINPSLAYVEEEITEEIEAGCGCDTDCGCGNNENEEEKVCTSESCDDPDCSCHQQQDYASLWENIRKKKERIKSGSGEK